MNNGFPYVTHTIARKDGTVIKKHYNVTMGGGGVIQE